MAFKFAHISLENILPVAVTLVLLKRLIHLSYWHWMHAHVLPSLELQTHTMSTAISIDRSPTYSCESRHRALMILIGVFATA